MPGGDEDLVVLEQGAPPVGVEAADVAHVVAVALQELQHRKLVAEQEVSAFAVAAGRERPVVAELVGPAGRLSGVEVRSAVLVVRLPRAVGGLEHDLRGAGVVAHDERDVALVLVGRVDQVGDVDAADGVAGNRP